MIKKAQTFSYVGFLMVFCWVFKYENCFPNCENPANFEILSASAHNVITLPLRGCSYQEGIPLAQITVYLQHVLCYNAFLWKKVNKYSTQLLVCGLCVSQSYIHIALRGSSQRQCKTSYKNNSMPAIFMRVIYHKPFNPEIVRMPCAVVFHLSLWQ